MQNERFAFLLIKTIKNSRRKVVCCRLVNGKWELLGEADVGGGRLYLFADGSEGRYSFFYGLRERQKQVLAAGADGSILSTLVADGYVGTGLGMYASSGRMASDNYADFDWFRYEMAECT